MATDEVAALRVGEVARRLGVQVATVKRIPPREIPFFRLEPRGDRRYLVEDVEAYISRRMVTS